MWSIFFSFWYIFTELKAYLLKVTILREPRTNTFLLNTYALVIITPTIYQKLNKRNETEEKNETKGLRRSGGRRGIVDKSTVFLLLLCPFFFSKFCCCFFCPPLPLTPLSSRLFSFLTAAMCLISDVMCSRPWAGAVWWGMGLTLGRPPSTHQN